MTDFDPNPPSKTALKREADRMQDLGARLTELNDEQLESLALPDQLFSAIKDYQRFPSHGAQRRQRQFIGKLMRDIDPEPIEHFLSLLDGQAASAKYAFHQLEQWRDALITAPTALTEFIDAYPDVDRHRLRQLVKTVQKATDDQQRKKHAKDLFRFLREVSEAH